MKLEAWSGKWSEQAKTSGRKDSTVRVLMYLGLIYILNGDRGK
jgi:hypothetical protein